MNQLPDELLQLIATYLKPVPLAEKTLEELLKFKYEIDNASKHSPEMHIVVIESDRRYK